MNKITKLHETLFKYGYFYDPLFVDAFMIDLNIKDLSCYDESTDMLYINSKSKNGKNLYKEFVKKNYKEKFDPQIYNKYKTFLGGILEVSAMNDNRYCNFSVRVPLELLIRRHNIKLDYNTVNYDAIIKKLSDKITKVVNMSSDIIVNGTKSKYIDECYIYLNEEFNSIGIQRKDLDDPLVLLPLFTRLKQKYVEDFYLLKSISDITTSYIDGNEFFSCFDFDKFALLFGKIVLEKTNRLSKESDATPVVFPQVYNYIHFVEELGLKDYNPKIMINKGKGKKVKLVPYTFNDLKKEVKKYLDEHPDYTFKYVSIYDPVFDKDIEEMTTHKKEIEKEAVKYRYGESYQNIVASWEFIKKGEIERKNSSIKSNQSERRKREDVDIDYRMSVFNKTDYICQIVGKNKFQGYVGYIYPNGVVAFERFYDERNNIIRDNNATYIMNIDNFEYFSSLSKPEIIDYIKDMGNEKISRKYHSSNWEKNVRKIVENPNCDEELKEKVKAVITDGRKIKKLEC